MKTLMLSVILAFFSGMLVHDGYDNGNVFTFMVGLLLALLVITVVTVAGVEGFG